MNRHVFLLLALALVGCERSQSYYQTHSVDRAATLKACAAGRQTGRDCENAGAAAAFDRHKDAEKAFRSGIEG